MTTKVWRRMQNVRDRAWELYQASSSSKKEVEDFGASLKAGEYAEGCEYDLDQGDRTCPLCGSEKVCGVEEAEKVFTNTSEWGKTGMLERADLVCSWCHAVRVEEEEFPDRPQGVVEGEGRESVDGMEW